MKKIFLYLFLCLFFASSAWAVSGYPNKCSVTNKILTAANTEYQLNLPEGTGGFTVQSRTAADFKIGNASTTGTVYYTVKSGAVFSTPTSLNLWPATPNTTIFLQSGSAGQVIEVLHCQ